MNLLEPCVYCGCGHTTVCPRIRAIEYHPDGSTKRVEFHDQRPAALPPAPLSPFPPGYPLRSFAVKCGDAIPYWGSHENGVHA